jgi:hypothetical protein
MYNIILTRDIFAITTVSLCNDKPSSVDKFNVNILILVSPYMIQLFRAIFRGLTVKATCFTVAVNLSIIITYIAINNKVR